MQNQWQVIVYHTAGGECPFLNFHNPIRQTAKGDAIKILSLIKVVAQEQGYRRAPFIEQLDKNLWQVRVKRPLCYYRILYYAHGNMMILFQGFVKKTNKTPKSEIKRGNLYLEDYKERSLRGKYEYEELSI